MRRVLCALMFCALPTVVSASPDGQFGDQEPEQPTIAVACKPHFASARAGVSECVQLNGRLHRVAIRCVENSGASYYSYGPWVGEGAWSVKSCHEYAYVARVWSQTT